MKLYDNEESNKVKRNNKIMDSFNNAIEGIVESVHTERNMLIHIVVAILVLGISFFLDFSRIELILVAITIILVLATELINTSIEVLTDIVTEGKYHPLAKKVKDISAGAVLLTAINAVTVGYLIIFPKFTNVIFHKNVINKVFRNPIHMALISILIVLTSVLLLKGIFYKKNTTYLFGGAVSGHAALAFNLATIGAFLSKDFYQIILYYFIAFLVAESRYEAKIHSIIEIIFGSLLGIFVAIALYLRYL